MKRTFLICISEIIIFFGLIIPIHAQGNKGDESFILLMAARNAVTGGWENKAIQRYEIYLKKNPEDMVVELELADFLQNTGRYHKAEVHYNSIIQKTGRVPESKADFTKKLFLNAARNAVKNKNHTRGIHKAIQRYEMYLKKNPEDVVVELELADFLQHTRRYHRAEIHYDTIIRKTGKIPEGKDIFIKKLYLNAARNTVKNKNRNPTVWIHKVIQRYETYLRKNPEDIVVESELADFLQDNGYYCKAEIHYSSIIQKIGEVPEEKNSFAKSLFLSAARNAVKNKNKNRAVEYYKQTLLFDTADPEVEGELAGILANLERFGEALELCEKILRYDPQNTKILTLKTNLLVHDKKYSEARETLINIPSEEKNNLEILQLEADVEMWSGNYDTAADKYQALVNRFPENRNLWSHYMKVLSLAKRWSSILDAIQQNRENTIEITDDIRFILVKAYLSLEKEEKAVEVWKAIHRRSNAWRTTSLTIADKFLARKKLIEASNILEEALYGNEQEAHLVAKLAIIYAYREMPEKGFEILNQFPVSAQSRPVIEIAKAEIFSLTERYEDALSILNTVEKGEENELRTKIIEMECYYALERDKTLLKQSSLLLEKFSPINLIDKSKILTLRILSHIRMGLYREAEKEIEVLSEIKGDDFGPVILTVLLHDARRQLKEYEKSIQALGTLLSEFSTTTEMVRPRLLDDIPLSAWRIADELAMHRNPELTTQLAKAECKAGNFQQSLDLYKELYEKNKDLNYKLGMVECYLNMHEERKASALCEEIQILNLSEKEMPRYLELLVKLQRKKRAFYTELSSLPSNISHKIAVSAITIIVNIQSKNYDIAHDMMKQYLSNPQKNIADFKAIIEHIGYFDKGKKSKNYTFARSWLYRAIELFPSDTGLQYQYARLLANHGDYDLAIKQFLILQKENPKDTRILRWLAQVNSWKQEYDESIQWYDLYLKERPADFNGRREVAREYGWALRIREANKAYKKLCEDYPEDYELLWEWQAKRNNWLGRRRTAISYYKKLAELHPKDTKLLFDLGQMYSLLDFSLKSEDVYQKLLLNAKHNRAPFAEESEQWRRKQSVRFKPLYIHQEGSGDDFGNFEITMFRTDLGYSPVQLSEAMGLSFGLGNTLFKFKEHSGSVAEHLTLSFHKHFENGITTFLNGELSTYSENRHETIQFETGIHYRIFDIFHVSLLGGREDVLQNFNTLKIGRARYYTGGNFVWDISQRIDIFSQVKQYWYNDGNNGTEDYSAIGYKLSLYPKILKLTLETYGFDVRSRREEYWSPDHYRKYLGGVTWRHYLGKEHFSGAPKLYYELALKQGVDKDGIDFTEPKFEFGWDNQRRLNIGFEIRSIRSTVYDEERANLFFHVRF